MPGSVGVFGGLKLHSHTNSDESDLRSFSSKLQKFKFRTRFPLGAIPQKRLPQGEKMKVTYKVCFPLKIYEEGLHFDDEVKKVGNYMTSISFSAIKRDNILQEL